MFLIQIIEFCQIVFSSVISKGTVTALEGQIEEHLKVFKQLFSDKNITPKQHYGIHIPSHIIRLRPPTRVSSFSFESAHNYFKELAQKQNFKNFPVSLAKRHQKNGMLQLYKQTINTGITSFVCNWKNVWFHKTDRR